MLLRKAVGLACGAAWCIEAAAVGQQVTTPGTPPPGAPDVQRPSPPPGETPTGVEPPADEKPAAENAEPEDGAPVDEEPLYVVGVFNVVFASEHPQNPSPDDLLQREVELGLTDRGYVSPGVAGSERVKVRLMDVPLEPARRYSSNALARVARALVDEVNRYNILGVSVSPSEEEFAAYEEEDQPAWGRDLRKPGQTTLTMVVKTGVVTELRTLAFGERVPVEQRINNPLHKKILERAPVQVYARDDRVRRDLLRKDLLDQYVYRLNRHPGRRVDLAVSAAQDEGGIALDLLMTENKPWLAYFQASNTGTKSTQEWRERFGFVHNQLTNNDDILSIDYVTAGFTDAHAVNASYDFPIWSDWLRLRPFFGYNQYTASDVGFAGEEFEGQGWNIGAELTANIFQLDELFIDAYGSLRYEEVEVDNTAVDVKGDNTFLLPGVGLKLERTTDIASSNARLGLEWNLPGAGGTNGDTLDELGRLDPDEDWVVFQFEGTHAFYLEPLLFRERWEDTSENGMPTLAHELALSLRAQWAFDNRLIPNAEQVVGGLYTVRGYDESLVAGDSVLIGSAEYRFHVPQALRFDPNPGTLFGEPFRWRPQQPYGRADWDLVLKGFIDAGRAINSDRKTFESDETLVGAGFGVDLAYKRYLTLRVDWGFALEDVDGSAEAGDNRVHFVATLVY